MYIQRWQSQLTQTCSSWEENLRNAEDEFKVAHAETVQLRQEYQTIQRDINGLTVSSLYSRSSLLS